MVATLNDQGSTAHAEVAEALIDAGIPRIATNVINDDWDAENVFWRPAKTDRT